MQPFIFWCFLLFSCVILSNAVPISGEEDAVVFRTRSKLLVGHQRKAEVATHVDYEEPHPHPQPPDPPIPSSRKSPTVTIDDYEEPKPNPGHDPRPPPPNRH
ncbi:unnamed protein product [Musa acuminata subsp. burmannicoides]